MKVLGIETSCDETAAAIVSDGKKIESSVVLSQIPSHAAYGGVIPELAAREHLHGISTVVKQAINQAGLQSIKEVDAIAVTQGPGLIPALLVGVSYAKGLALSANLPLIGVNHFLAHIYASFLGLNEINSCLKEKFPVITLVVSGGHTALLKIDETGRVEVIGQTLDDAAGEAFDKAAKLLSLGYPGGPIIDRLGKKGNAQKYDFPRSLTPSSGRKMREEDRYNFSFSGLKTALYYHVKKLGNEEGVLSDQVLIDSISSYQEAIVDVLVKKTLMAVKEFSIRSVVVCGGVACNSALRNRFTEKISALKQVQLLIAPPSLCTDNAVMVAGIGYPLFLQGKTLSFEEDAYAKLPTISSFPMNWQE